ncbi:sigma-70 family RNA polymerase sigma factor [Massilia sp. G4R7]|uniref:Sigma-70 family RNA polymerase sigma factor n=1 Tax=Massilia phyllostachyos TaxID=2898585 RepID=A0ABS8Q0T7_9BURK|nr:sigma-70 family RNA polymerase sigma factor [Massilia phyllostachyos]
MRRPELAEEVLQESFIAIWNHSNEYQNSMSAPMTWMTTIVRNKSFDLLRRAGEEVDLDAGDFDQRVMAGARDMGANPADAFELSSEARALAACLAVLEEKQRDVIGLAFFHDLSHGDVARRLALPVGTVKTWIRRGLVRLHACLTGGRTA